jgi:hypothetical protein
MLHSDLRGRLPRSDSAEGTAAAPAAGARLRSSLALRFLALCRGTQARTCITLGRF